MDTKLLAWFKRRQRVKHEQRRDEMNERLPYDQEKDLQTMSTGGGSPEVEPAPEATPAEEQPAETPAGDEPVDDDSPAPAEEAPAAEDEPAA